MKKYVSPRTRLPFGRWKGKTLTQLLFRHAAYFFWLHERKDTLSEDLQAELDELYWKARHAKIPAWCDTSLVAEYRVEPLAGELARMELVPSHREACDYRLGWIDMGFPKELRAYDKPASPAGW